MTTALLVCLVVLVIAMFLWLVDRAMSKVGNSDHSGALEGDDRNPTRDVRRA